MSRKYKTMVEHLNDRLGAALRDNYNLNKARTADKEAIAILKRDQALLVEALELASDAIGLAIEEVDLLNEENRDLRLAMTACAGLVQTERQQRYKTVTSIVPVVQVGDEMAKRAWAAQKTRWGQAKEGIVT